MRLRTRVTTLYLTPATCRGWVLIAAGMRYRTMVSMTYGMGRGSIGASGCRGRLHLQDLYIWRLVREGRVAWGGVTELLSGLGWSRRLTLYQTTDPWRRQCCLVAWQRLGHRRLTVHFWARNHSSGHCTRLHWLGSCLANFNLDHLCLDFPTGLRALGLTRHLGFILFILAALLLLFIPLRYVILLPHICPAACAVLSIPAGALHGLPWQLWLVIPCIAWPLDPLVSTGSQDGLGGKRYQVYSCCCCRRHQKIENYSRSPSNCFDDTKHYMGC